MGSLIAVIGDTHGDARFHSEALAYIESEGVNTVVQVGDWDIDLSEEFRQAAASFLDSTSGNYFFVDGNHDEICLFQDLVEASGHDGTEPVSFAGVADGLHWHPNLHYCPRGSTVQLGQATCLFLGGGVSVDRDARIPGVSWWPQEQISVRDAYKTAAAAASSNIDIMFTHDAPTYTALTETLTAAHTKLDETSVQHRDQLRAIVEEVGPSQLYHGHYHWARTSSVDIPGSNACQVTSMGANVDHTGSSGVRIDDNVRIVTI